MFNLDEACKKLRPNWNWIENEDDCLILCVDNSNKQCLYEICVWYTTVQYYNEKCDLSFEVSILSEEDLDLQLNKLEQVVRFMNQPFPETGKLPVFDEMLGCIDFYSNPLTYFGTDPKTWLLEDYSKTGMGQKPGKYARKIWSKIQDLKEIWEK